MYIAIVCITHIRWTSIDDDGYLAIQYYSYIYAVGMRCENGIVFILVYQLRDLDLNKLYFFYKYVIDHNVILALFLHRDAYSFEN